MFLQLNHKQVELFLYWIKERHNIYLRREAGLPKPWTTDPILQQYFFTNPYRENDRVTKWWREQSNAIEAVVLDCYGDGKRIKPLPNRREIIHPGAVIFATIAFRWFNYIPTGQILTGQHLPICGSSKRDGRENLLIHWNSTAARERLADIVESDQGKVFTGAYIIKSPNGKDKVNGICDCIDNVWEDLDELTEDMRGMDTLEAGWNRLLRYPYLGDFMAYEVISDLRHTTWFNKAGDINTWANLGPGGVRGLRRCCDENAEGPCPSNSRELMRQLHNVANYFLCDESKRPEWPNFKFNPTRPTTTMSHPEHSKRSARVSGKPVKPGLLPHLEMREIEHSLCEFDKYCRAKSGEGRMKRQYPGI